MKRWKNMDVEKWITEIDAITGAFHMAFSTLTVEQLNWRPHRDSWSIGQNIDHLIVINQTYFDIPDRVRNGNYRLPFIAKIPFMVSWMGKTVLNAVQPDRKNKMRTFRLWEPRQSNIPPDILEQFGRHQAKLKELIATCSDLLDQGTIISSPANKNIVYKLETAFDIMLTHERRHFEQASEIAKILPVRI